MFDNRIMCDYNIKKKQRKYTMNLQDFVALLALMIRDEAEGTVEVKGNEITVTFTDGVVRTVEVK